MVNVNNIIIGCVFVLFGTLTLLSDKWLLTMKIDNHQFIHVFFMWFLKQILQVLLLPLYLAISKNFLCFGRCRHGQPEVRVLANPQMANIQEDEAPLMAENEDPGEDNQPDEGERRQEAGPRRRKYNKLIFIFPALVELAHVMLVYFGLQVTYSSSLIMLKGSVMLFTAILSIAFLTQQLQIYSWFGLLVAIAGFSISGISDYVHNTPPGYEKYGVAAGDLLIVLGQIMFASKVVFEENFMRKHSIHTMFFLGAEAAFGVGFAGIAVVVFNFVDTITFIDLPNKHAEDVNDFFIQLLDSPSTVGVVIGSLLTYIVFAYLGIVLVKRIGALPRIMLEGITWTVYWAFNLGLGWDNFYVTQIPGLCMVPVGVLIYSHVLQLPCSRRDPANNVTYDLAEPPVQAMENNDEPRDDGDVALLGAVGGEPEERNDVPLIQP